VKVILCTHNSGGVGKTTLAVHLAGILARYSSVLLIDCDDQADSYKFFVGEEPDIMGQIINTDADVSVIANPDRISVRKIAKPNRYDYIVLDMDTPIPNIVKVIVGSNPDLILIPVSKSHKRKGSGKNLEATLDTIEQMQGRIVKPIKVTIVPLGIDKNLIKNKIRNIKYKPDNLSIADSMRDLDSIIEDAVYEDRRYIWKYSGCEDTEEYFNQLII
jgi:chromosome partitioning protein